MTWTTNKPTETGWYFAYGNLNFYPDKIYFPNPPPPKAPSTITLVEVMFCAYGTLVMHQGTHWETSIEDCGYTHWQKIELPKAPQEIK